MLLASTTSELRLVTSAAATIEVTATAMDVTGTPQVVTPVEIPHVVITTATTTDIVGSPAAATQRRIKDVSIRNDHASVSCIVEVLKFDGTTEVSRTKCTLLPGEVFDYFVDRGWKHWDANGTEYFQATVLSSRNSISAALTPAAGASTYLTGTQLNVPSGGLKLGTTFFWRVQMTKTAAGTAATTWVVRIGTLGTTGDAAICSHVWPVGTAAVDFGYIDIFAVVRGPLGASCIMFSHSFTEHNLATTGLINVAKLHLAVTSAGFVSTTTGLIVGLSVTTGASVALTLAHAEVIAEGL